MTQFSSGIVAIYHTLWVLQVLWMVSYFQAKCEGFYFFHVVIWLLLTRQRAAVVQAPSLMLL